MAPKSKHSNAESKKKTHVEISFYSLHTNIPTEIETRMNKKSRKEKKRNKKSSHNLKSTLRNGKMWYACKLGGVILFYFWRWHHSHFFFASFCSLRFNTAMIFFINVCTLCACTCNIDIMWNNPFSNPKIHVRIL